MRPFLTAEWRDLIVVNYQVDPALLAPFLPAGTEIDLWEGVAMVSLVAFRFLNTRVLGVSVPLHAAFEEVNLRFYVKRFAAGELRRGVVFIREFVPKAAVAMTANLIYGEPYACVRMSHRIDEAGDERRASFTWIRRGAMSSVSAVTSGPPGELPAASEAEFILEHYWGYTRRSATHTTEYHVSHPRWRYWKISEVETAVDFHSAYEEPWASALRVPRKSAFVAEGSAVAVFPGRRV